MFDRLLVVCTGNICRSPMGEYLIKERAQQLGIGIEVASAGLGALVGQPAAPNSVAVMADRGIDISAHRAQQLQQSHISEHDLILVMEQWQRQEMEKLYPVACGRVHLMGKWGVGEIEDPYEKPIDVFREVLEKIDDAVNEWSEKLWIGL